MARNDQLIRQHKLLQILERTRFGYTLNELRDALIDELGLSSLHTRTLRRDIEALQEAGLDISSSELDRGRVWKLGESAKASYQINATATELLALSVGRDLLNPLRGTFIGEGITSFWNRVQEVVPSTVWQHYEKIRQVLFVSGTVTKSYEEQRGVLKTIERAILQHRWCSISYSSPQRGVDDRKVSPRAILFHNASLYVVAELGDAPQETRHWKLDRIKSVVALDEYFESVVDEVQEQLAGGLSAFASSESKQYEIILSERAAMWVEEEPWHPQQIVTREDNGQYRLVVQANHDLEIIPKILAFGEHAELLSPDSSRECLLDTVKSMRALYED